MQALVAVTAGDGIGPEVTAEAVRVLERIGARCDHSFRFESALLGGAAIDATGEPLPEATLELCRRADAVLLGAVGGPRWSEANAKVRPEQGLLQLRKSLGLFANLRPVAPHPAFLDASPIKAELLRDVDIMVVRELTGGIYFGESRRSSPAAGAASSPPSTKPTCLKPRGCGAPWSSAFCPTSFPTCATSTC